MTLVKIKWLFGTSNAEIFEAETLLQENCRPRWYSKPIKLHSILAVLKEVAAGYKYVI
jgi:hypothetical protein